MLDNLIHHMIQTSAVLQDILEADLQVVGFGEQAAKDKMLQTREHRYLTATEHPQAAEAALDISIDKKVETGIVHVFVILVVIMVIALEFYSVMHIMVVIPAAAAAPNLCVKHTVNVKHGKVGVNKVVTKTAKAAGEAVAITKDDQEIFGGALARHQTIIMFLGMLK